MGERGQACPYRHSENTRRRTGRCCISLDWLEPGDIEAALHAAAVFGDDHLQCTANATVRPETFSHGTSQQRVNWFKTGYIKGRIAACDTFTAVDL